MFIDYVYFYNEKKEEKGIILMYGTSLSTSYYSLDLVADIGPQCNKFLLQQLLIGTHWFCLFSFCGFAGPYKSFDDTKEGKFLM